MPACGGMPTARERISIPHMEPGEAVFRHGDVVHAVEDAHRGSGDSNVMYIAPAPGCARSDAYLWRPRLAFLRGESPPDFPADHFELDFDGHGGEGDRTTLGHAQMGFTPAA